MFERLIDAKGTFEGKCISVIMSIVLVFGMTNVLAFAQVGSAEAAGPETGQVDSNEPAQTGDATAPAEGAGDAADSATQGTGFGDVDKTPVSSGGAVRD